MFRRALIPTLLLLVLSLAAGSALACTCTNNYTPTEAYEHSYAVFSGKVVGMLEVDPFTKVFSIQVYSVWKGPSFAMVSVATGPDSAACGYEFQVGEEYLVYAYSAMPTYTYSTDICTRTRLLSNATEDLASLGTALVVPTEESTWGTMKALYR
jgi:hypothetical protein